MANGTYDDKTLTVLQRMAFERLAQAYGTVSGQTQRIVSSDTAQALPTSVTQNGQTIQEIQRIQRDPTGQEDPTAQFKSVPVVASSVTISAEVASIRYTFGGATPTQGTTGIGHVLAAGQSLKIDNPAGVASFRFISATAATPATLQVTAGF